VFAGSGLASHQTYAHVGRLDSGPPDQKISKSDCIGNSEFRRSVLVHRLDALLIKAAQKPPSEMTMWIIFGVVCVIAAAWTWKRASLPKLPAINQTIVSTLAFGVWAYATGSTPPLWPGQIYNPLIGSLLLIGFSLVSGLLTKP